MSDEKICDVSGAVIGPSTVEAFDGEKLEGYLTRLMEWGQSEGLSPLQLFSVLVVACDFMKTEWGIEKITVTNLAPGEN